MGRGIEVPRLSGNATFHVCSPTRKPFEVSLSEIFQVDAMTEIPNNRCHWWLTPLQPLTLPCGLGTRSEALVRECQVPT